MDGIQNVARMVATSQDNKQTIEEVEATYHEYKSYLDQ